MKKKEMIPLTDEEKEAQKIVKFATYVKKNFVQMKIIKKCKKSEIIVIAQENKDVQLIVIVI